MAILQRKEDKIAYLKGMVLMAKADGKVEPEEITYINTAAIGMGLNEVEQNEISSMWESADSGSVVFSSKLNAAFFVQEAVQIAYVDGNCDEKERKLIYTLWEQVGFKTSEIAKIENCVEEGIQWKKRGEKLLEEIAG